MSLQIRIRVFESFDNIFYIKSWLEECASGFAFCHNKPNNKHYHIYLFGFDKKPDGIRKTLGRYLKDKTLYSVSTTAGKSKDKILPQLAWQYGTEETLEDPVWIKGFSEENIRAFEINAKEYYELLKKQVTVGTLITREDHYIVRADRVWERLYGKYEDYANKSVREIKSKIATEWINNGKAMPRPSDLHRYAVSLYYVNKANGRELEENEMLDVFPA